LDAIPVNNAAKGKFVIFMHMPNTKLGVSAALPVIDYSSRALPQSDA